MTTVTAPSRLHFGLLHLPREGQTHWPSIDGEPGLPVRNFGGVGLMITTPHVRINVEPSLEWEASGYLSHRALAFGQRFAATIDPSATFRIRVQDCPEEHTGFGVGTSLALAVSKGIAVEMGHVEWSSVELAGRVGRGERSAVGVHGFQHGGLIIEGGKRSGEVISPLIGSFEFPKDWKIILVKATSSPTWAGRHEREAFSRMMEERIDHTATLTRLVLTSLVPALVGRDFEEFSEALYTYNALVGESFRATQGGIYSSESIASLIHFLRKAGIRGVGQSSWGPIIFGVIREQDIPRLISADFPSHRIVEAQPPLTLTPQEPINKNKRVHSTE